METKDDKLTFNEISENNLNSLRRLPCLRTSNFFKRSKSTLCLGGEAPDPFKYTLNESLPLATKPHLLQPHSRLQDLFRVKCNHLKQYNNLKRIGLMSSSIRDRKTPNLSQISQLKFKTSKPSLKKQKTNKKQKKSNEQPSTSLEKQQKKTKKTNFNKYLKLFTDSMSKVQKKEGESNSSDDDDSSISKNEYSPNKFIDRWRLTVDLFGRVFCEDVGLEPGSIIRQLGGFQLKEAKFRREMERLRNIASRDLSMEVERDRNILLQLTFKSLNNMFNRRSAAAAAVATSSSNNSLLPPPLCMSRIKVTFRDEQGEGSGVARSFYTAFAEAILADLPLPPLDLSSITPSQTPTILSPSTVSSGYVPFNMLHRYRNRTSLNTNPDHFHHHHSHHHGHGHHHHSRRLNISQITIPATAAGSNIKTYTRSNRNDQQQSIEAPTQSPSQGLPSLSTNARSFYSPLMAITSPNLTDLTSFDLSLYNSLDIQYKEFGQILFTRINNYIQQQSTSTPPTTQDSQQQQQQQHYYKAAKITGMLLELRSSQIQQLINNIILFRQRVDECLILLINSTNSTTNESNIDNSTFTSSINVNLTPSSSTATTTTSTTTTPINRSIEQKEDPVDNSPLFWCPNKQITNCAVFYSPRGGHDTPERLNAFRNVGRIMAICLLQNELCPIAFNRHVLKFILYKPIRWHDLAFFDSQMYESFRKMINDAEK
jgi:hypothetical protein